MDIPSLLLLTSFLLGVSIITSVEAKKKRGCKYLRNSGSFGRCDGDGYKHKTLQLSPGSLRRCPPTKDVVKNCKSKKRKMKNKRKGRRGRKGCVYMNKDWSPCDEATKTRQRERILMSGNPKSCHPKKIVTKKCKKDCRYIRGEWSECDIVTNSRNRTLDPKPGSLPQCESKVQTKPCFVGAGSKMGRPTKCRYKFGHWNVCDSRTNTMTREMTLRRGDPNLCKRTVQLTRKCRLACKFRRGKWSSCDKMTRLMMRVDTLMRGDPNKCEKQRTITKKCRKPKCKYSISAWTECSDNKRTRFKTLEKGDVNECTPKKTIVKPCVDENGKARCFFGKWGEFGPCTNGVMTKQRALLQGGVECERRAVVTKACDN